MRDPNKICGTCAHLGFLKDKNGEHLKYLCLSPVTYYLKSNSNTLPKNRFVFSTHKEDMCELWTEDKTISL